MKKIGTILFVLVIGRLVAMSAALPSPEDAIDYMIVSDVDWSGKSFDAALREIGSELKKHNKGIGKIKIVYQGEDFREDMVPGDFRGKNLSLGNLIRIFEESSGKRIQLDYDKKDNRIVYIYVYKGVTVSRLQITSKLPNSGKPELFSGKISLSDFISGELISQSMSVAYSWERDLLQVQATLNRMLSRGATIEIVSEMDIEVGFVACISTDLGKVFYYVGEGKAEFLNLNHTAESMDYMADIQHWMTMRLPEDYRSRMADIFNDYSFEKRMENKPGDSIPSKAAPSSP